FFSCTSSPCHHCSNVSFVSTHSQPEGTGSLASSSSRRLDIPAMRSSSSSKALLPTVNGTVPSFAISPSRLYFNSSCSSVVSVPCFQRFSRFTEPCMSVRSNSSIRSLSHSNSTVETELLQSPD